MITAIVAYVTNSFVVNTIKQYQIQLFILNFLYYYNKEKEDCNGDMKWKKKTEPLWGLK